MQNKYDKLPMFVVVDEYPDYAVSDFGVIFSFKSNKKLKTPLNSDGYAGVKLFNSNGGKSFKVHQLVAMMFLDHVSTGQNRGRVIDHINGDRSDNRLENLQIVTPRENRIKSNHNENTSSKYLGVCFDKSRGKWLSSIKINGKQKFLGRFDNELDAYNAYISKLSKIDE